MNVSLRRFASALVASAGLVVALGASSASATPFMSTDLNVISIPNNDYILRVAGHIEMSIADALAACSHTGDPVDVELYGQDAGILADDLLITKSEYAAASMSCSPTSTGLDFVVSVTRDGDVLNEDRPGQDELYAYVTFFDIRTGTTHVNASDVEVRNF
jgi:hypothetical protein